MKTFLLLLLAVTATACEKKKACTLIGCSDQASIVIRRGDDGALPLVSEVDLDGRKVTCPPQQTESTCGSDVRIAVRPIEVCTPPVPSTSTSTSSPTCMPSGRFEEVVTVAGTPSRVIVTLSSGALRTLNLSYSAARPNGPGCDPVCRQASESWDLPAPADGGAPDGSSPDGATDRATVDATADAALDAPPPGDAPAPVDAPAPADAVTNDSSSDSMFRCGTTTCAVGEVCVERQVFGGACFPVGDAACPVGYHPASPCCVADPTYQCAARPAACGTGLSCACAGSSLCGSGFLCGTPSTDQIRCTLLAP